MSSRAERASSAEGVLPLDPALPGLEWLRLGAPERLARARGLSVVEHRPGRRAVRRSGEAGAGVFWKVDRNERGARAAEGHAALGSAAAAGALLFRAPRLVGYWPAARVLAVEEVAGIPLAAVQPADRSRAFRETGAALASLHSAPIAPARIWSLGDEARVLERASDVLREAAPGEQPGLEELRARIIAALASLPPEAAPIHRDFHPGQVLWDPGAGVALLDLDDLALGHPLLDVGNFTAHLRLEAIRSPDEAGVLSGLAREFLDSYRASRGP